MDVLYGKQATLPKIRVLEVVARVPYQAWEQVAYIAVTHKHETPEIAKNIHLRITNARSRQDNEQWHLLILEDIPWNSIFVDEYGVHKSVADLLRQIGYDERVRKEASLEQIQHARFTKHPTTRRRGRRSA